MKLSDYVFKVIADTGVKHVFMVPGGGCMHLCDSLGRNPRLTFVANLHEQASAIAADAYGQYNNHLGVALVTTGPGGTNAITGVAAAWLDSIPCLFVSGQVKRADMIGNRGVRQMGYQEIDIVRLVGSITKYAVTVMDPRSIRYHLEKALHLARHGRPGPVWIDIPLDVQAADVPETSLTAFDPAEVPESLDQALAMTAARQAVDWLRTAQRPVLLAGNGVRLDGALSAFNSLLEVLPVPVLTTWKAADFLAEDHPLYAGRPGSIGQRGANFAQQNADLFLAVGARLDFGQTGYVHGHFARAAKKIIVDIDPAELRKFGMPVDLAVSAGAKAFLGALIAAIRDSGAPLRFSAWLERCQSWKRQYPVIRPEHAALPNGISNYALIDELSACLPPGVLLIPGSAGACSETMMQAFRIKTGQRMFNSEGLGPMGFGIPAAIGGCLASDRRRTVCVDGDGGFAMNIQELEVVRRLNLPIKFFVLDNNGYGSIRQTQNAYFKGNRVASDPGSGLTLPNFATVARSFGIEACEIFSHDQIKPVVHRLMSHDRPGVCVAKISPEQTTAPRLASGQRSDGSMYSRPMEDMWPFLDRAELAQNMMVPLLEDI
jgi:acetolactate synthase I/II/III large subunit